MCHLEMHLHLRKCSSPGGHTKNTSRIPVWAPPQKHNSLNLTEKIIPWAPGERNNLGKCTSPCDMENISQATHYKEMHQSVLLRGKSNRCISREPEGEGGGRTTPNHVLLRNAPICASRCEKCFDP